MGAVAAAAAGRISGWGPAARAALAGESPLPTLAVDVPVAAVAAAGDRLVAVGGSTGDPMVWSLVPEGTSWELEAGRSAFPTGVGLRSIARSADEIVVVGSIHGDAGPRPAIFRSGEALTWERADDGLFPLPGVLTAVAEHDGQLLAVGSRFADPNVGEPIAQIAAVAGPGKPWTRIELVGVDRTRHGAATLLASVPEGLMLAVTDIAGMALYLADRAPGPWRRIGLPRLDPPAAIVAGGPVGSRTVLAALDSLDRARLWLGGSRGWREIQVPGSLPAAARVMGLADRSGSLVAAVEANASSFVEEVAVA
jgi:hypothetical protein